MHVCPQCGFDLEGFALGRVPAALRDLAGELADTLARAADADVLRRRPSPETWSALEHACHVRDLLRVQRDRLQLALEVDLPTFAPMRQAARAVEERYNEQDPAQVADRIRAAADKLAAAVERLETDDWDRPVLVSWLDPPDRTVWWLVRNSVHRVQHHLGDVVELAATDPGRAR